MTKEHLLVDREGDITTITLNRAAHHSGEPTSDPSRRNGVDSTGMTSE